MGASYQNRFKESRERRPWEELGANQMLDFEPIRTCGRQVAMQRVHIFKAKSPCGG